MGFVLEKISDEEKTKLNYRYSISRRAIDYEQNIFLIRTNQAPADSIRSFELHFHGDVVSITVDENRKDMLKEKGKYDIFYIIRAIKIPKKLESSLDAIKESVIESLRAYGTGNYEYNGHIAATFSKDAKIEIVDQILSDVRK